MHTRVTAGICFESRAAIHRGAEHFQPNNDLPVRRWRNEDVDRPVHGGGQGRSGQCGISTGGNREGWSIGGGPRRRARLFGDEQVQHRREQMAGLVTTPDLTRLVLDPHAPVVGEPEDARQRIRACKRSHDEAGSCYRGHRIVERSDELDPFLRRQTMGCGKGIPCEMRTVRDERIRVVGHRTNGLVVLHDPERVVRIRDRCVGTRERQWFGDVDECRTDGAAPSNDT
jgi:hypothetical protein